VAPVTSLGGPTRCSGGDLEVMQGEEGRRHKGFCAAATIFGGSQAKLACALLLYLAGTRRLSSARRWPSQRTCVRYDSALLLLCQFCQTHGAGTPPEHSRAPDPLFMTCHVPGVLAGPGIQPAGASSGPGAGHEQRGRASERRRQGVPAAPTR